MIDSPTTGAAASQGAQPLGLEKRESFKSRDIATLRSIVSTLTHFLWLTDYGLSARQIAAKLGIGYDTTKRVRHGKTWKNIA